MKRIFKILAVDREEIILKSIRKALRSTEEVEYNIVTCNAALEGLKLIRSDTFSLVLMDLVLPGMNGFELLRRIKNIDPALPVIIMSGIPPVGVNLNPSRDSESPAETLNKAEGFLLKPFTTEEIRTLVLKILKQFIIN
jgi:CheY-like chemotaxis protein